MTTLTSDTFDAALERDFRAAKGGDPQAYSRLVAATQRMVASVALGVTRDVQLSQDIAQETFLSGWQRLGQMRNPASFLPWLRQIARNRARDHLRSLRYRETSAERLDQLMAQAADPRGGPAESLSGEQDAQVIAAALDEIPEECREVLLLFYREGQSSRDVAVLLGLSDAAVRKRLQRGRQALRAQLLERFAEAASASGPDAGFTAAVSVAVAMSTGPASAGAAGIGSAFKAAPKLLFAAFGALAAAIGVVVGAVFVEMKFYLRRARSDSARRALRHNGIVYAALMATYMVVLKWLLYDGWSAWATLIVGVLFSLAITALALVRRRILREQEKCR